MPKQYNQTSSGRWDASGSWSEAVERQQDQALEWAESMPNGAIAKALVIMMDSNAYTTYERKALLFVAANRISS